MLVAVSGEIPMGQWGHLQPGRQIPVRYIKIGDFTAIYRYTWGDSYVISSFPSMPAVLAAMIKGTEM